MAGGECCSLKLILSCVKDVGIYGALNNILEEIESDILVHEIIEPCKVNLLISVLEECYRERGPNQYPVDRHEVMTKCQRLVLHIMNSSSLNKLRNEVAFNVLTCFNKFVKCFLENSNKHPNNFIKELFETVIRTLNYEDTASNNNANRKASVILELAETLITWLNRDLIGIYSKEYNHFVSAIINHLVTGSQSETYTLTYYKLLPAVVKHSPNVLNQLLNSTFTLINDDTRTNDFSKMLTLLSAVVDYELDVDAVIKLSAYKFCYVLQQCICGGDPVLKKKSLFLLKIISSLLQATQSTYWRASESCWIDLVLVYECLGESQVHVIQPVLPKINFLITTSLNEDQLHVSWILVILQLMLTHESKIINRWGIEIFLENTIAISNLKQPEIQKFAEELLLPALNNCSLYPRSCDVNLNTSCPSVTSALIKFFREFSKHALNDEDCRIFFCRTIHNICDISWNAVPLVYLLYSLTQLPSRFLLSDCCINYFSDLMCAPVSSPSHQASVKTVLQILVAKVVFQLIDMKSINLSSLSKLFANFKPNYFFVDSPLWKEVVEWMANVRKLNDLHVCFSKYLKVIKKELSFEKRNFNGCENPESLSPVKIREAVRMLLLIIDSGYFEQHSDSFRQYFDPMVDVLTSLNTRLYMPPQIIRQALTMFKLLLQHSRIRDDVARNLTVYDLTVELAETCSTEIVKYVAITTANSVENEECLDVLLIPILNSLVLYPSIKCKIIQQLMSAADNWLSSILNSQKPNDSAEGILYKYNSLKMLSWITAAASSNGIPSSKLLKLVKGRNDILSSFRNVGGSRGQFKSDYVDYVWKLINYYINSDSQWSHNIDYQSLLNDSLSALDVSSNCTVITIMNCLSTILNQVPGISPSLFEKCLSSVWSIAIEHKGNEYFKMIVDAFINMAYKMESLKNCEYTSVLVKYTKLIYDSSVSGSGVYILLVNRFADILISNQGQNIDKENIQILIYGLIYGTVYRKDQRILNDVIMFVKEELDSKISISSMLIEDQTVRSTSVLLLTYLSCMHHDLIEDITERLLEQIEKISSGKRCRHFANSLTHRLQQRLWQAFLVLQPKWSKKMNKKMFEKICNHLTVEGQQISVKILQEWILVNVIVHVPELSRLLPDIIKTASLKRIGCVGSFLSIMVHVILCQDDTERMEELIILWLTDILPWCTASNFIVRVYALVAIHKIREISKRMNLKIVLKEFEILLSCFRFDNVQFQGNTVKNIDKLLNDFYFMKFNTRSHYTLQTIFYELPRLCHVTEDEWIPLQLFTAKAANLQDYCFIPLRNADDILSRCQPSSWFSKSSGFTKTDAEERYKGIQCMIFSFRDAPIFTKIFRKLNPLFKISEADDSDLHHSDNVQKKIIPSNLKSTEAGLVIDNKQRVYDDGLIVVASLIDKIPNLGGLCRTCEVFAASQYIVSSLKHLENKEFQSLSVTADRWIKINEVRPCNLKTYLLDRKSDGYTVVGAEQTADSISLNDVKFPKKTLLLLGNEKEGLPANLIQLLDMCVEIPQHGVIRSLNVHVSGALLLWEYRKQHDP